MQRPGRSTWLKATSLAVTTEQYAALDFQLPNKSHFLARMADLVYSHCGNRAFSLSEQSGMIAGRCQEPRSTRRDGRARGFTLIELLIVIGIIAVLLSLILPMLRGAIASSRSFNCQMSLRSTAYDFTVFADDVLHGPRGSDSTTTTFSLSSFQDSLYGVNEFWAWPQDHHTLPDANGNNPMRCSEVRGALTMHRNAPCDSGGVTPLQNVSFGLNARLHWREITSPAPAVRQVRLSAATLAHAGAMVPLAWDIDGARAAAADSTPFYAAPSLDSPAVFAGDQFWHPGMRHNGGLNVAFIDGHVASTRRPLGETGWMWGFVPAR